MRIGASLFLIAIGAILKFAVTDSFKGIDLGVVGVVLMIVGAVGLLIELFVWGSRRRSRHVVVHEGYVQPGHPAYPAAPVQPVDPGTNRY